MLEAYSDDGLTTDFDHAGANEEPFFTKLRVPHPSHVGFEVVRLFADRLSDIRCPVLVVASDGDYTPVELKREYASLIQGAVVTVLKDSRHAAPLDQPAEFNRVVLEFLDRADVTGRPALLV